MLVMDSSNFPSQDRHSFILENNVPPLSDELVPAEQLSALIRQKQSEPGTFNDNILEIYSKYPNRRDSNLTSDVGFVWHRRQSSTDHSSVSDNVFMSPTDSDNSFSLSPSILSPNDSHHERVKPIVSSTFYDQISNDGVSVGTRCQAQGMSNSSMPTFSGQSMMNGTFGPTAPMCYLPPRLHCPIMMLKTSIEIESHRNQQAQPYHPQPLQQQERRCLHTEPNIRQRVKMQLNNLLLPGNLIQVSGPPMAGKSTLVRQTLKEHVCLKDNVVEHHFTCKQLNSLEALMSNILRKLLPEQTHSPNMDEQTFISQMKTYLRPQSSHHHILVFHKCEAFRLLHSGNTFYDFLSKMRIELSQCHLSLTIIFTTYKKFPQSGPHVNMEIDLLTDIWDVVSILQFYAPHIEVLNYAHICLKFLCLPEAVRLLAERFIASNEFRVAPDVLEKNIFKDMDFLSAVFSSRLNEVEDWIPRNILTSIVHFSHSIDSSFIEDHLQHVCVDGNQYDWLQILQVLRNNYIIRSLPGIKRSVVHPLVVYYCKTANDAGKLVLHGHNYDLSCSRFANFLCRILQNTEANMRIQGRKGLVYGGLIQEWPNFRYLIERALHCNENTYEALFKVSLSGNGLITRCFAKEAKDLYSCLYTSALQYGSPIECAILQALLGNALGMSSALDMDDKAVERCTDWNQADKLLNSAIKALYREGPSYYLLWAIGRKAMFLHRQGKYQDSRKCFEQGQVILRQLNKQALGERFFVSDLQVEEERITQEIHQSIPNIFTGQNILAREKLNRLLEYINDRCENHPELSTLLNLIGLTEQRGHNDLDSALKWYKLSYNERMYLNKLNPENLMPVLNNIAMILLEQGKLDQCINYLNQALDIRRECGWKHYFTALTLTHMCEVYMKNYNFIEAYKSAIEAEKILKVTTKEHDMILRINFTLAHLRVVLRQKSEPNSASPSQVIRRPQFPANPQNMPDLHVLLTGANTLHANRATAGSDHVRPNPSGSTGILFSSHISPGEIEPADMSKSANDFLELALNINEESGTLSDDGHKNFLASHTHAMVLNWGNIAKLSEHREAILRYIQKNSHIETSVFNSPIPLSSRYELLRQQASLFYYIRDTPIEHLDLLCFLRQMVHSCHICRYVQDVFTEKMWEREAQHLIAVRHEQERLTQDLDRICSNRFLHVDPHEKFLLAFTSMSCNSEIPHDDSNELPNFSKIFISSNLEKREQEIKSSDESYNNLNWQSGFTHSEHNNQSKFIESPIIQEQKELLQRAKFQNKPQRPSDTGFHHPHLDTAVPNFQITGPCLSKVMLSREPVEQSEDETVYPDDHFCGQSGDLQKHLVGHSDHFPHLDCLTHTMHGQSRNNLELFYQAVSGNSSPGEKRKQQESSHCSIGHSSTAPNLPPHSTQQPHARPNTSPQSTSVKVESPPISVSHYLLSAWPTMGIEDSPHPSSSPDLTSEKMKPSKCPFVEQYFNDLVGTKPESSIDFDGSVTSSTSFQKECGEKLNCCDFKPLNPSLKAEGQRPSLAESGFVGSSLGSSEDDPQHSALSRNMLSHNTAESGYNSSQGARPKISLGSAMPLHNTRPSSSDRKKKNLDSSSDQSFLKDLTSDLGHQHCREPSESSEFMAVDISSDKDHKKIDKDPDEDSWCDTITPSESPAVLFPPDISRNQALLSHKNNLQDFHSI